MPFFFCVCSSELKPINFYTFKSSLKSKDGLLIDTNFEGVIMEQNYNAIFDQIAEIVDEKLSVNRDEILPTSSFIDDLRADSLDLVDLVMGIEEAFDLQIPDEDIQKMTTVNDAVIYVVEQQKKG